MKNKKNPDKSELKVVNDLPQAERLPEKFRPKDGKMEAAKKLLEKERQERAARCGQRIDAILQEENCFIDGMVILKQQGMQFQYVVVAKD